MDSENQNTQELLSETEKRASAIRRMIYQKSVRKPKEKNLRKKRKQERQNRKNGRK